MGRASLGSILVLSALVAAVGCRRKPAAGEGARDAAAGLLGLVTRDRVSDDGIRYTMSTGRVPSFDGLPLDVDLTLPEGPLRPRPLVVFFHGWGADKTNWESDAVDNADPVHAGWNNVALVARGYAVLDFTARGWRGSCGPDRARAKYMQNTLDPECLARAYWTHVADPDYEIRDARHLIGALVDARVADPAKVGVTGGSYGGAQVWMLALGGPFASPAGVRVEIAAAAPFYTWSSLTEALLPNGRATHVPARTSPRAPVGVPLGSYLRGFFANGPLAANGFYAPPGKDPTSDFTAWFARFSAGAPFLESDPVLARSLAELDRRSPREVAPRGTVPIFQVQGTTDPLFPAVHALEMRDHLRARDPRYPITTVLADVGHDNAQNPRAVWTEIHGALGAFFDHHLLGVPGSIAGDVTVHATVCVSGQTARAFRAESFLALARSERTFRSATAHTTTHASMARTSVETDPVLSHGCRTTAASHAAGSAWSFPVAEPMTLVGAPRLTVTARIAGTDATLAARLWDVHGSKQTLVTRGIYRWLGESRLVPRLDAREITFELAANAWEVQAGHALGLEIVGSGAPEFEANLPPAAITIEAVAIRLPIAE